MGDFKEKRKHTRIASALSIQFKELHGNSYLPMTVSTKNVSLSGVRFISDRFIQLSHALVMEIALPHPSEVVKVIAKVSWLKKMEDGKHFDVGNHFLAMSDNDERRMRSYIDSFNPSS